MVFSKPFLDQIDHGDDIIIVRTVTKNSRALQNLERESLQPPYRPIIIIR